MLKLVPILLLAFLVSCASRVKGLQTDKSFNYNGLLSGQMVVGGVVHPESSWNLKTQMSHSNKLKTAIIEEEDKFKVASAGYVRKKLGKTLFAVVNKDIEENGVLGEDNIAKVSSKLEGKRYITFARVERDATTNDRKFYDQTDKNGNKTGIKNCDAKSKREMDVNFLVYDLKSKKQVWSGVITKSKDRTQTYQVKEDGALVSLVKAFQGNQDNSTLDEKYPFPKAPKESEVLAMTFKGFAENLPEED